MYSKRFEKETFKEAVRENVRTLYRKNIAEASPQQIFQAVSYAVKDIIMDDWIATQKAYDEADAKAVYYMSMEFLMGRALGNKPDQYDSIQRGQRSTGRDGHRSERC